VLKKSRRVYSLLFIYSWYRLLIILNDKHLIMDFNKTDEELKKMNDDELFDYLDAKAKYLAKGSSPLSIHKSLRYASLSSSISNQEFNYDGAINMANKSKEEGMKKFNDKKRVDNPNNYTQEG
jgi:hypothetical protein